jgi:hypothetical protein
MLRRWERRGESRIAIHFDKRIVRFTAATFLSKSLGFANPHCAKNL